LKALLAVDVMSDGMQTEKSVKDRPPIQKWAVIGVIVFFVLGYILSEPCLCREGAVKGFYMTIFYLIVLVRLLYSLFKRNLRLADYLLWVVFFVVFCIFVAYL
jgi:hypothetical protein